MAFELKSLHACFLLLLLLLQLSDGFIGAEAEETLNNGSFMKEISNRKLLVVNGVEAREAVFDIGVKVGREEDEGWELRAAPLGPDPLHHHGADPTRPRAP